MTSETPAATADVPQLVLLPGTTPWLALPRNLWSARALTLTLARRDFFVRYRRAAFGVLWAVLLPALQAVVLSVILRRIARFSLPHFPVFVFAGVVAWTFFSSSLSSGATAIVDNSAMSSRIYFPRAVLPLSVCIANSFSLAVSLVLLLVVATSTGLLPGVHTLYLIPAVLLLLWLTLAVTLVVSALYVYFRDTKYAVQAALLVWFYVTPIFYPLALLHGWVRTIVELNPMTGCVELFRASVMPALSTQWSTVTSSVVTAIVLTGLAYVLQSRYDRLFADLL
jgi:lipopolysaccharide transport system permease protein